MKPSRIKQAQAAVLGQAATATSNKRELFFRSDGSKHSVENGISTMRKEDRDMREREKKEEPSAAAMQRSNKSVDGYVGFANLPNQVYRKSVKRGFEFTLMVVGESGLGKSTLINSLFMTELYNAEHPGASLRIKKTVQVESTNVILKESGVQLQLQVVDTPGFGDAVDNSNCWQTIIDYIEQRYEEYLNGESRVNRKTMPDARVHCCLYFISPNGHGLKPLDIEFMKKLHDKVNIIPVIAKADTMTPEECTSFKKTILNEIAQHKIKIYDFPDIEDEEENKTNKSLKERVPFAVVGSNTVIEVSGKKVRGRRYPWGIVEVENMEHCDFIPLRNMLVRTHMMDLKDVTNNVHYENFRCRKLVGITSDGKSGKIPNKSPMMQIAEEKKDRLDKMKKTEQQMEQVFEMKVKEKMLQLRDSEADLQKRHEQMKKSLEQQEKELEEKRRQFENEKSIFESTQIDSRTKSLEAGSKENARNGKYSTWGGHSGPGRSLEGKKKDKKKGFF
ncbi:PREDICTED: septin-7-like isoform X3 [Priapulus caudatus]|uniref:Septin-7-like isoform X3 n=1 Tax=Priapulus caudatus TaxID=37621 RepID=A0ABM1DQS7_PRICU|nr:PREDICTED: septin-7-like isoform X3 [Priapulus caudatus]